MPQTTNKNSSAEPAAPATVSPVRTWLGRAFLTLLLVALALLLWQRQAVSDWLQLAGYQPPASIVSLADQTTMTPAARHLFYLNHPQISSKSVFATQCSTSEQALVLGCYKGGESGIYILNIANHDELKGVMQVTAAHEMLHAAYDRLSTVERQHIDTELQDFYDHGLKSQRVKDEINAYKKTEPHQLVNEMHSIFATEVTKLPTSLEQYYQRYFTNRQVVVDYFQDYQQAFTSREAAIKNYDSQLASLKQQIDSEKHSLEQQAASLDSRRHQLDQERARGNASVYNHEASTYNSQVRRYNAELADLKADIARYNQLVAKRNALVIEEQRLVKQLSGEQLPAVRH